MNAQVQPTTGNTSWKKKWFMCHEILLYNIYIYIYIINEDNDIEVKNLKVALYKLTKIYRNM